MANISSDQLPWRKSTLSANNGCVEAAPYAPGFVAVRDSKNPDAGMLIYDSHEWRCFIAGVRNGEFDDLAPGDD